jgi:hypothetical protein
LLKAIRGWSSIPVQADSGEMLEQGSELGSIGVVRQRQLE